MSDLKVLILNGSPKANGNTSIAISEIEKELDKNNIQSEVVHVGHLPVRGCIACGKCSELKKCQFDDIVNEIAEKLKEADGLILASPVYYANANATLIACLDRLFFSSAFSKNMKVGASVVVARRGGCSATYDELNKYFTIAGMPVVSSTYWNSVHGAAPGQASEDLEGLHTMRVLANNMAFLLKSIALGKKEYGEPEIEPKVFTNFIR